MSFDFIQQLLQLKNVVRQSPKGIHDTAAGHTWGCIILAEYFLSQNDHGLDKQKINDLLIYHDIVEVLCGDVPFVDEAARVACTEDEAAAAKKIREGAPLQFGEKFFALYTEYEQQESREARYARCMDLLEPMFRDEGKREEKEALGYTREFMIRKKQTKLQEFSDLHEVFLDILDNRW